ncbi:MAG: sulfite exporter TauE/SafE family protein [Oscillospiraceae bacterium]|nr:sulfite exporter TauE/SafE family protein [Oscillospiraceae bacterium]
MTIYDFLVSLLSGTAASMGIGGGFILLLYLTVIKGIPQFPAQGVNLLFFIPIAVLSLIFHVKNKLVVTKPLLPALLCGAAGVGIGVFLLRFVPEQTVSRLFGVLVMFVGVNELFHKSKNENKCS